MLRILSVFTYLVLTLVWSAILALYLKQRREARRSDPLVAVLLSVLALDAFKSTVESVYFGLVWGSQYRILGDVFTFTSRPGPLIAVKLLNLVVAAVVLTRLIRVWVPSRLAERREQLEKLQELARAAGENAERFRVAFDTIPDSVTIGRVDDGVTVAVNAGFCRMTGRSESEAIGHTSVDFRLWVNPELRHALFEKLRVDGYVAGFEAPFRRKNGTIFTAMCTSRVFTVGDTRYFLTISRDTTGQRRAEQAQAAIYRIAEAASTGGTLEQLLADVHEAIARLMQVPNFYIALHDAETQTLTFPYFTDEHDAPPVGPRPLGKGLTEYVLRTGQPLLLNDEPQLRELIDRGEVEDMGAPSISWMGVPLRAKDHTVGVLAAQIYSGESRYAQRDIELLQFVSTQIASAIEKKQAELALRENEMRFRALIERTSDGICLLGAEGTVHYASPAMRQLLGYERGEPVAALTHWIAPDDMDSILLKLAEALDRPGDPVLAQGRLRRKDGSTAAVEGVFTNLLREPAVRGIVLNVRDLTDRKRMEAQLMMADRMASVGVLAAGVAHEINNPLAYVIGNLDLIAGGLDGPAAGEALSAAQEGAERVRQIVRDLKTFSRADETRLLPTDVHLVLDSAVNMARNEIRHRAELHRNYQQALPPALASEARLGQVVLNLLVNAAQAMPDRRSGNTITLVTRSTASQVVVEVRDTGTGIPPEHRARLFDPFFTTKPVGVGTGLGLYICHQIIGAMGGSISVESEVGKGTTFSVSLPIAHGQPLPESSRQAADGGAPGRRILTIDDEPQIGSLLSRTLDAHEVVALNSAAEAIARIRSGERFHVIICDLMMPQMTGMDLHQALAREFPEQARRMLFLTGGAFTVRAREYLESAGIPHLQKPFEITAMRRLIADRIAALG